MIDKERFNKDRIQLWIKKRKKIMSLWMSRQTDEF